jgi:hypothetical protein
LRRACIDPISGGIGNAAVRRRSGFFLNEPSIHDGGREIIARN